VLPDGSQTFCGHFLLESYITTLTNQWIATVFVTSKVRNVVHGLADSRSEAGLEDNLANVFIPRAGCRRLILQCNALSRAVCGENQY
jgi:hypothetical protein